METETKPFPSPTQSWSDGHRELTSGQRPALHLSSEPALSLTKGPRSTSRNPLCARQPLFWAALAFALGLWIGRHAWRPPSWWLVTTLVFACSSVYFLRHRPFFSRALAYGAFVLAGALTIQTWAGPLNGAAPWFSNNEQAQVIAHVVDEGNVRGDDSGTLRQRIDVETERVQSSTRAEEARFRIRLSIYSKAGSKYSSERLSSDEPESQGYLDTIGMRVLHYGERIQFSAALNAPRNYRNPGAFDYAGYLRDESIAAIASVKYQGIEVLPGFSGALSNRWLARIRRSIVNRVHGIWPEEQAGLIDAMLIGEKAFVERSTRVDFQRCGTYHLLVVAGLHVGVLAGFVLWIVRRFRSGEGIAGIASIAAIFLYAALTKEGIPVWRAALMFSVYILTRLLYRRRAMLNALGAAALVLMLTNPGALFAASFQMSMICVGVILGIAVPLLERTVEPYARGLRNIDALAWDRSLPPHVAQFRIDLRMILKRLVRLSGARIPRLTLIYGLRLAFGMASFFVISATMQLGMALPMAFYFHRATSVALPANLLVVPFLQLLMPAAVVAVGASYLSLWLAKIPAAIAGFALLGITGTVHWLGALRLADVRVATPTAGVIVVAEASILLATIFARRRALYSALALAPLTVCAIAIWKLPPPAQIRDGTLEVTAIDVGQGDSILIALPEGRTLLLDAGGLPDWTHSQMDVGEDVVSPYLWARGISHIDVLALTHAHADHMGGMPAVIANFHPTELWLPEGIRAEEITALLQSAERFGLKVVYRKAGDTISYGGAVVRVLAPNPDFPVRVAHRNDESLVLKLTYGNTSALLEADAERGTERLVASDNPAANVLKVAHHGSASGTNKDLLAAVHPQFAVISVGARNVYGHPRYEVLERLQDAGVKTYRTDEDGATTFYLDGKRVTSQLPGLH